MAPARRHRHWFGMAWIAVPAEWAIDGAGTGAGPGPAGGVARVPAARAAQVGLLAAVNTATGPGLMVD